MKSYILKKYGKPDVLKIVNCPEPVPGSEEIRVKIENNNLELIPGALLEITVQFNNRDSQSIPDTSVILEGDKVYVYKIIDENIAKKLEIKIGTRNKGNLEVISGLTEGDIVVAEGLKKVRPNGKIKPINK